VNDIEQRLREENEAGCPLVFEEKLQETDIGIKLRIQQQEMWFPKSLVIACDEKSRVVTIATWLAEHRGLA